ncbi:cytochrome c biogenesis protein ResB [Candidatus Neomarinimicrobiota bacterium]
MLKRITSYRFAFILLSLLLVAVLGIAISRLWNREYPTGTNLLVIFGVILFLSLIMSLYRRLKRELRRIKGDPESFRHYRNQQQLDYPLGTRDLYLRIRQTIQEHGWKVPRNLSEMQFTLEKGKPGVWGSLIFHTGLAVIVLGVIISVVFGFRGMFALTEGETFAESRSSFRTAKSGLLASNAASDPMEITLKDFNPQFRIGDVTTQASQLSILTSDSRYQEVVYFNHGLRLEKGVLHQHKWGYSPGLIIEDPLGRMVFNGFVRIASLSRRGESLHRDQLDLDDDTRMFLELTENHGSGTDSPTKPGQESPTLVLRLQDGSEELFSGRLRPGETASINGYLVAFLRYRHWAQFELVRDPSLPVLIGGFILAVVGLLIRITFARQRIVVSIQIGNLNTSITISGWSEKYPASFKERFLALVRDLEISLQADTHSITGSYSGSFNLLREPSHATC